jgi:hypothetical protein
MCNKKDTDNNNNNNNNNNRLQAKVHTTSTHQPTYWRMKTSSCTGIAA